MGDLHLTLPDALRLAAQDSSKEDMRAMGALAAAACLLWEFQGDFTGGMPDVLEGLLESIQERIDQLRAIATGGLRRGG